MCYIIEILFITNHCKSSYQYLTIATEYQWQFIMYLNIILLVYDTLSLIVAEHSESFLNHSIKLSSLIENNSVPFLKQSCIFVWTSDDTRK